MDWIVDFTFVAGGQVFYLLLIFWVATTLLMSTLCNFDLANWFFYGIWCYKCFQSDVIQWLRFTLTENNGSGLSAITCLGYFAMMSWFHCILKPFTPDTSYVVLNFSVNQLNGQKTRVAKWTFVAASRKHWVILLVRFVWFPQTQ